MPRLTALGGFDAKGPASFLLEIGGRRLLLDLGRGPDAGRRPRLDGAGPIDAVLISHGHADHVGSLDLLERIGRPPVHATAPVRALAQDRLLAESADLPRSGEIAGIAVETGPTAHAPGSVWMRIGGPGGLVYSGDFSGASALFPAQPMAPAAAMVVDCSYGLRAETLAAQRAALLAAIGDGPCLLPAPAEGRGLELALACLDAGRAVAICPATRAAARGLLGQAGCWLAPDARPALERLLQGAGDLHEDSALDRAMIAAGANCGSGLSARLGPRALAAGVPVILTGHLSEGSPARDWVDQGRARRMGWNVHPDRAALGAALAQVAPAAALAAFAARADRRAVEGAFPGPRWSQDGVLAW